MSEGTLFEMREIALQDVYVGLASAIQEHGVRKVLIDFQQHYPGYFSEMHDLIHRLDGKPIAALFR